MQRSAELTMFAHVAAAPLAHVARSPEARSDAGRPRAGQAPRARGELYRCPSLRQMRSSPRAEGAHRCGVSSSSIRLCHTDMALSSGGDPSHGIALPGRRPGFLLPAVVPVCNLLAAEKKRRVARRLTHLGLKIGQKGWSIAVSTTTDNIRADVPGAAVRLPGEPGLRLNHPGPCSPCIGVRKTFGSMHREMRRFERLCCRAPMCRSITSRNTWSLIAFRRKRRRLRFATTLPVSTGGGESTSWLRSGTSLCSSCSSIADGCFPMHRSYIWGSGGQMRGSPIRM